MELIIRATVLYWFLFLVMRGSGRADAGRVQPTRPPGGRGDG